MVDAKRTCPTKEAGCTPGRSGTLKTARVCQRPLKSQPMLLERSKHPVLLERSTHPVLLVRSTHPVLLTWSKHPVLLERFTYPTTKGLS